MDGLNRAMLLGGLGQDPELKFTGGGQAILTLRVATESSYKKGDERQKQTEWHTVKLFGKRAEALNKLLSKGSKVYVEGRITTRSWDDAKSGGKRYATEIVADNVILCDGKRQDRQMRVARDGDEPTGTDTEGYF
jgi:single-strand DNA-binding protein